MRKILLMPPEDTKKSYTFISPAILPDGNGGFTPCPELMTEAEAIRFLRLDIDDSVDPKQTLKYYRDQGQLIAIKVGRRNRYRRQDLENFLAQKSVSIQKHSDS